MSFRAIEVKLPELSGFGPGCPTCPGALRFWVLAMGERSDMAEGLCSWW